MYSGDAQAQALGRIYPRDELEHTASEMRCYLRPRLFAYNPNVALAI